MFMKDFNKVIDIANVIIKNSKKNVGDTVREVDLICQAVQYENIYLDILNINMLKRRNYERTFTSTERARLKYLLNRLKGSCEVVLESGIQTRHLLYRNCEEKILDILVFLTEKVYN